MAARKKAAPTRPLSSIPGDSSGRRVTESGEVVIGADTKQAPIKIPKGHVGPIPEGTTKKRSKEIEQSRARSTVIGAATRRRRDWEKSEVGVERTKNASDLALNVDGSQGTNIPVGMVYELLGFNQADRVGPAYFDEQLPGMADPNMAPRPPRWDELTPDQQSHTVEALKRHGTSIDQMSSDFGAQLDQSYMRARNAGADKPFSEDFYEPGSLQRETMRQSAADVGLPPNIYATTHGMTSPNVKFESKRGSKHPQAGETYFPNDESAKNVAKQVQMGIPADQVTNDLSVTGMGTGKAQGYVANMRKAALSLEQFAQGLSPSEWKKPSGKGFFDDSPKAGPYANAWASDTHPEFFVSDVHSGGGGMIPHLGADKPVLRDADGKVRLDPSGDEMRDKSEREKAIASIPFFHSASDHAARQAMAARNLSSVRRSQAGEWGEEQIQRGQQNPEEKYRAKPPPAQLPGQMGFDI